MKRGLAVLTKEKRKEIARSGGKATSKKFNMKKIGQRGGAATKELHGKEHYSLIGKVKKHRKSL